MVTEQQFYRLIAYGLGFIAGSAVIASSPQWWEWVLYAIAGAVAVLVLVKEGAL